jgi:hypothetical protein
MSTLLAMEPADPRSVGTWLLRRCRVGCHHVEPTDDPVLAGVPSIIELEVRDGVYNGQEFLVDIDGRVAPEPKTSNSQNAPTPTPRSFTN